MLSHPFWRPSLWKSAKYVRYHPSLNEGDSRSTLQGGSHEATTLSSENGVLLGNWPVSTSSKGMLLVDGLNAIQSAPSQIWPSTSFEDHFAIFWCRQRPYAYWSKRTFRRSMSRTPCSCKMCPLPWNQWLEAEGPWWFVAPRPCIPWWYAHAVTPAWFN